MVALPCPLHPESTNSPHPSCVSLHVLSPQFVPLSADFRAALVANGVHQLIIPFPDHSDRRVTDEASFANFLVKRQEVPMPRARRTLRSVECLSTSEQKLSKISDSNARPLWAGSLSAQSLAARVEAGVEDEASAFGFNPTAEGACVLVVAAFQPEVRAMRYYVMLGHPSGVPRSRTTREARSLQSTLRGSCSLPVPCTSMTTPSCWALRRHVSVRNAAAGNCKQC